MADEREHQIGDFWIVEDLRYPPDFPARYEVWTKKEKKLFTTEEQPPHTVIERVADRLTLEAAQSIVAHEGIYKEVN